MNRKKIIDKYFMFIGVFFLTILLTCIPANVGHALEVSDTIPNLFPDSKLAGVVIEALQKTTSAAITDNTIVSQYDLNALTTLNAANKGISSIQGIGYLNNLDKLNLDNNQITTIPAEISYLTNLEILTMNHNKIALIPDDISNLTALETLSLAYNNIIDVPVSITYLPKLKYLTLNNNQILNTNDINSVFNNPGALLSSPKLELIKIDSNNLDDLTEIEKLPSSIAKYCSNQRLSIYSSGDNECDATQKLSYPLPEIFDNNTVTVISGNATIVNNPVTVSNITTVKKIVECPLNVTGNQTVVVGLTDGLGINTTYTIQYSVSDTTPPAPPIIDAALNNSTADSPRPTISGTAERNSTIILNIDGNNVSYLSNGNNSSDVITTNVSGVWSYVPHSNMTSGSHFIYASAVDASKNYSLPSATTVINIDSITSNVPVISSPADNYYTNSSFNISGTVLAGTSGVIMVTLVNTSTNVTTTQNTTAIDANGNWSLSPTSLSEGIYAIKAQIKDSSNNLGILSKTLTVIYDKTSPRAPLISTPINNSTSNSSTIVLSGTAEPYSTITVLIDGAYYTDCSITDASGKWNYTSKTLQDGRHSIAVYAKDRAKNIGVLSSYVYTTINTAPPSIPVADVSITNNYSNNKKLSLFGTSDVGTKVYFNIDNALQATFATTDASRSWKYTPKNAFTEGSHYIIIWAVDSYGVQSNQNQFVLTIDTTSPNPPRITYPTEDVTTNNPKPLIYGTADINTKIAVTIDGKSVTPLATADGYGNWSFTPTVNLSEGVHKIMAKAQDLAGNLSAGSNTASITIKTVPPKPPVIAATLSNSVTANRTPVITGKTEMNTSVIVNIDGIDVAVGVIADASGNWSYTPVTPLVEGKHTITAKARDSVGNIGLASAGTVLTVNTTPPKAPVIDSELNNAILDLLKPTITGSAELGSKVLLTIDGNDISTEIAVDASGRWKYTPSANLSEGNHNISAKTKNIVGNIGVASPVTIITISVTPPKAPKIVSPVNNAAINNSTPTITGTSDLKTQVMILLDGGGSDRIVDTDATGKWSYTFSENISDGKHTITAKALSISNKPSPISGGVILTIDTLPSKPPIIKSPLNNTYTNIRRSIINGTSEANSKITVNVDGNDNVNCTTADKSGNWSYTIASNLDEGDHTIFATATDAAGNISDQSTPIQLTVYVTPPVISINDLLNSGYINIDKSSINGTIDKGRSKVYISIDNQEDVTPIIADDSGNWVYKFSKKLKEGNHKISARGVDLAGNSSVSNPSINFVVDTLAPKAPSIVSPLNNNLVVGSKLLIKGTGEVGGKLVIIVDNNEFENSIYANDKGTINGNISLNLSIGKHILKFGIMDKANNMSELTSAITLNTRITPVNKLIIKTPLNASKTKDRRVNITGSSDPNSSVTATLVIGKNIITINTKADKNGNWSAKPPRNLAMGNYILTVKAVIAGTTTTQTSGQVKFAVVK